MTASRISSEKLAAALAEMSALLGSSLDYERSLPRLVRLAVPALGDLCAVDLVLEDETITRVVMTGFNIHVSKPVDPAELTIPSSRASRAGRADRVARRFAPPSLDISARTR